MGNNGQCSKCGGNYEVVDGNLRCDLCGNMRRFDFGQTRKCARCGHMFDPWGEAETLCEECQPDDIPF